MAELHPINRTLLTVLENQVARTDAALADLPPELLDHPPGGDCNTIRGILVHLVNLRAFLLLILESPRAAEVSRLKPEDATDLPLAKLRQRLDDAAAILRMAISEHDHADWYRPPVKTREGHWGDLPTIERFVRPFNDYTNHLGAIRAIRRAAGSGAEQTQ